MTIKNTALNGTDWVAEETVYAEDLNDTLTKIIENVKNITAGEIISVLIDKNSSDVDTCEAITDWTNTNTTTFVANTTHIINGTNALELIADASNSTFGMYKTVTSANSDDYNRLRTMFYCDSTNLAKITSIEIKWGSDSSNYFVKSFTANELVAGWNSLYIGTIFNYDSKTGTPTNSLTYFNITITKPNDTDTTNIWIDDIRACKLKESLEDCNGQTCRKTGSVLDDKLIPDLNNASDAGTFARFLRGSLMSGSLAGTETHAHSVAHAEAGISTVGGGVTAIVSVGNTSTVSNLPPYYNIVWMIDIGKN